MNRGMPGRLGYKQGLLTVLVCLFGAKATGAPGDLKWQKQLCASIIGAPTLTTEGDILVGSSEGTLYCLTPDGSNSWSFTTSRPVLGTPAVAEDGTIYFGSDKLYALNADGSKRWEFELETFSSLIVYAEDPAIGPDGAVYVARPFAPSGEGRLHAINPDGTLRWTSNGDFVREVIVGTDGSLLTPTEYAFACINPDGTTRWSSGNNVVASAAVVTNGTVLVPVNGYNIYQGALQALTPAGSNIWQFSGNAQALSSPVVGMDGTIYYAFDNGRVVALDSAGGLRWEYTMPETAVTEPIWATPALAADGTLYFSGGQYLHALDTNGAMLWRFDCGANRMDSPLIGPDGIIYVGDNGGVLYALEGSGAGLAAGQWPMSRRNAQHRARGLKVLNAPPPPTGLAASFTNYTDKVLLTWISAPPASYYVISRSPTTIFADAQVLAANVTGSTSFDDRTALEGVTYLVLRSEPECGGHQRSCRSGSRHAAARSGWGGVVGLSDGWRRVHACTGSGRYARLRFERWQPVRRQLRRIAEMELSVQGHFLQRAQYRLGRIDLFQRRNFPLSGHVDQRALRSERQRAASVAVCGGRRAYRGGNRGRRLDLCRIRRLLLCRPVLCESIQPVGE